MRDRSFTKNRGFNINGTTYLNFNPIKPLTITSRLGYRLSSSSSYGVSHDYYYHGTAKQDYIQVNASDYSPTYWQWENFMNYDRKFGDHNTTLMLGTSFSESRSFGVSGNKRGDDQNIDSFRMIPYSGTSLMQLQMLQRIFQVEKKISHAS